MKKQIEVPEPVIPADAQKWAADLARAVAALSSEEAERAQLAAALELEPAKGLRATRDQLTALVAAAQQNLQEVVAASATASKAVQDFEVGQIGPAVEAVVEATRRVGDELARMLAEATTSTALTATVDGLALRARFQAAMAHEPPLWDMSTLPFRARADDIVDPQVVLPVIDGPDFAALLAVLARLDDRVDAVADLVTAESVHHLVNGNPVRAGGALQIAASGSVPDEIDVIRTPVLGHDVTHRVVLFQEPTDSPSWSHTEPGIAATADPDTASWVRSLLPDPADVRLVVRQLDPVTGATNRTLVLTADVLRLDPLDWLRAADDPTELTARVAVSAYRRWADDDADGADGDLDIAGPVLVEDPTDDPRGRLRLSDLVVAASRVRRLLAAVRPLTTADLLRPGAVPPEPAVDAVSSARARVVAAYASVEKVVEVLEAAARPDTPFGKVIDALLAASALGVAEATPILGEGAPQSAGLRAQAEAAAARLRSRIVVPVPPMHPEQPQVGLDAAREHLATLCGTRLPLSLPMSAPVAPGRTDLGPGPVRIPGAEAPALRSWLYEMSRVRPAPAALLDCYDIAEALGCPAVLELRAMQLPVTDDEWAGANPAPRPGTLNVVAVCGFPEAIPDPLIGFVVDAWAQTVPDAIHRTGLAFHFDEPDARAVPAVLVTVAPDDRGDREPATWDLDTLVAIVNSTIDLAVDRAVAAELHPQAGIQLPDRV